MSILRPLDPIRMVANSDRLDSLAPLQREQHQHQLALHLDWLPRFLRSLPPLVPLVADFHLQPRLPDSPRLVPDPQRLQHCFLSKNLEFCIN